jgi:hypothetical protein
MPYTYKYDPQSETTYIGYVEREKEPVICKLCLDPVEEKREGDVCEFCEKHLNQQPE